MDTEKESSAENNSSMNFLFPLSALIIVLAGTIYAKPIIVPLLLSVFIAIICAPAMDFLEKMHLPRIVAFIIVIAVVIGFLTGVGVILGNSVNDFSNHMPVYKERLNDLTDSAVSFAEKYRIPISKTQILKKFNPSSLFSVGGYIISAVGNMLSQTLLIFVTVAFILFESSTFGRKIETMRLVDDVNETPLNLFTDNIKRYLAIKTLTSLLTAVLVVAILLVAGVDYPMLWGMLAFFLNFIPAIGAFLAAIPVVLMALIQFGPGNAIGVAVAYTVVNVAIGNFIEPKFMGKGLGLSPLVVFLSLVFWGFCLGPAGMFLSVPLTMTLKLACDSRTKTKWIGILLGP